MRLNGWCRLFILLTGVWVSICAYLSWSEFAEILKFKTAKFEVRNPESTTHELRVVKVVFPNHVTESDMGNYIDLVVLKYGERAFEIAPDVDRNPYMEYRGKRQNELIRSFLALTILPPLILLVFGLSVNWVIKGFRGERNDS